MFHVQTDKFAYINVLILSSVRNKEICEGGVRIERSLTGCSLGKGNFTLIYELIYAPNKKIWPYPPSLSLCSIFNEMWLSTCFKDDSESRFSMEVFKKSIILTVAVANICFLLSV